MENFEKKLEEYASLLVNVGLAVQKGQRFVIHAPVDSAAFARMCAKAGYAAGAKEVIVSYSDEELTRMRFLEAESSVFDSVAEWVKHMYNDYAEEGAAMLFIAASDPENLKGVDPDRIQRSSRAAGEALEVFRRLEMSNGFPWCVASIPIPSWAAKVFPEDGEEEAMAKAANLMANAFGKGSGMSRKSDEMAEEGSSKGSPDSGMEYGATAASGMGTYDLEGRSLGGDGKLPKPVYNVQEEGRVVVTVTVNPEGKVISANINRRTGTTSLALRNAALNAAKSAVFNRINGLNNQEGTITYYFKLK